MPEEEELAHESRVPPTAHGSNLGQNGLLPPGSAPHSDKH